MGKGFKDQAVVACCAILSFLCAVLSGGVATVSATLPGVVNTDSLFTVCGIITEQGRREEGLHDRASKETLRDYALDHDQCVDILKDASLEASEFQINGQFEAGGSRLVGFPVFSAGATITGQVRHSESLNTIPYDSRHMNFFAANMWSKQVNNHLSNIDQGSRYRFFTMEDTLGGRKMLQAIRKKDQNTAETRLEMDVRIWQCASIVFTESVFSGSSSDLQQNQQNNIHIFAQHYRSTQKTTKGAHPLGNLFCTDKKLSEEERKVLRDIDDVSWDEEGPLMSRYLNYRDCSFATIEYPILQKKNKNVQATFHFTNPKPTKSSPGTRYGELDTNSVLAKRTSKIFGVRYKRACFRHVNLESTSSPESEIAKENIDIKQYQLYNLPISEIFPLNTHRIKDDIDWHETTKSPYVVTQGKGIAECISPGRPFKCDEYLVRGAHHLNINVGKKFKNFADPEGWKAGKHYFFWSARRGTFSDEEDQEIDKNINMKSAQAFATMMNQVAGSNEEDEVQFSTLELTPFGKLLNDKQLFTTSRGDRGENDVDLYFATKMWNCASMIFSQNAASKACDGCVHMFNQNAKYDGEHDDADFISGDSRLNSDRLYRTPAFFLTEGPTLLKLKPNIRIVFHYSTDPFRVASLDSFATSKNENYHMPPNECLNLLITSAVSQMGIGSRFAVSCEKHGHPLADVLRKYLAWKMFPVVPDYSITLMDERREDVTFKQVDFMDLIHISEKIPESRPKIHQGWKWAEFVKTDHKKSPQCAATIELSSLLDSSFFDTPNNYIFQRFTELPEAKGFINDEYHIDARSSLG